MSNRLPTPIGRQREVLCLPASGHTVVLGTAGSGKTVLAIHRAVYLSSPRAEHCGRTLLVTFNKCLVSYLQDLSGSTPNQLDVRNYHRFARGYLNYRNRMSYNCICGPDLKLSLCEQAVADLQQRGVTNAVLERPIEILVEEFRWMAQHGVSSEQEYVEVERIGRAGTRIERSDRPAVYKVYERYRGLRDAQGKMYDWDDLAQAVVDELQSDQSERFYKHVVIDEGQDFSPMMLRSLAAAIPQDGSLTFLGDMAQQIYGSRMSWRDAGFDIKKVWEFKENYRNTQQIAQLALAVAEMPQFPDNPDLVEPNSPAADGPLPALVSFSDEDEELKFVVEQAQRLAETGTVAILLRERAQEDALESLLSSGANRLHRNLKRWPSGPGLFYGTYHAAKGLEFDAVYLPHLSESRLPRPADIEIFGREEASATDLHLLYVAITRAKSTLVLTYCGTRTPLLPKNDSLYQAVNR